MTIGSSGYYETFVTLSFFLSFFIFCWVEKAVAVEVEGGCMYVTVLVRSTYPTLEWKVVAAWCVLCVWCVCVCV